ncbi:hypothetical protein BV25DRAFT_1914105 [Artomyces pyxidatus]|uniref:Uncharacterized protein n=1 Tax=Artomyces pyxidatus TaxID=48021 RepID=A0ACB8T9W3_9AGAM|nr:hypothetical protein BV25DRAFT_1914105 [Artomyces pyxidatus]
MSAPTQQYPPWLSVSTSIATDSNGNPTATATTVLQLPLTYYGPSIPLGTDGVWVYGGLTSPAPSASLPPVTTSLTSAAPSSRTTSAIPPTSSSNSAIPSTTPTSSFSSSFASTPSSSARPIPPSGSSSSSHHKRTIIGAVLGSVLGSLLLLFLLIFLLRCRSRRGSAGRRSPSGGRSDNPLWMWEMVDEEPEGPARPPGEGSPRGSGEEADSFLRRSGGATDGMKERDPSARLIDPSSSAPEGSAPVGVALTGAAIGTNSSHGSAEKTQSGSSVYASVEGGNGNPTTTVSDPSGRTRHIIPRDVLVRMYGDGPQDPEDSAVNEEHEPGPDSPLLPPRPIDPDSVGKGRPRSTTPHSSRKPSNPSILTDRSVTPGNEPEQATVQTARRVRVDDLGTRHSQALSTIEDVPPRNESPGASWARAVGIGSLQKLGRLSWFRNVESLSSNASRTGSRSRPTSFNSRGLSDAELDVARHAEMGYRDGSRPLSAISGRSAASGNTIFYDASSETSSPIPPVPPLPSGTASSGGWGPSPLSASHKPQSIRADSDPPAYEANPQPPPQAALPADYPADYLDIPVPRPASPFATASSSTTRTGALRPSIPPGLALPNPHAWRDSGSGESPLSLGSGAGITIDVLEEAPPAAEGGWRLMSQGSGFDPEHQRRTTFGTPQVVMPGFNRIPSEEASLHSMRSHLSPRNALSVSGSAPASTLGSGSSHPSGHSQGRSVSSGASLAYSGSVSSDGRRRPRHAPGEVSPPISAVGRSSMMPLGHSHMGSHSTQASPHHSVFPMGPAPSTTVTSTGTTGTGETSSSVTTHTSVTDPMTGEVMRFPSVPWTGGLDRASDDSVSVGWGGSWSSPSHLRVLQNRVADRNSGSHS